MFVAVVVYIAVGGLVTIAIHYFNVFYLLYRVTRPGLVEIGANIVGGFVGLFWAKAACDHVVHNYSAKSVCILICGFSAVGLAVHAILWDAFDWDAFIDVVRLLTGIVASISAFWVSRKPYSPGVRE